MTTKFVHYMDMHSGGGQKEQWGHIYIESDSQDEADIIFYNRFKHNPHRVTCTCCGDDYSVHEPESLEEATRFQRNDFVDSWNRKPAVSLEDYLKDDDALVIYAKDIKPEERIGDVPEQGYIWQD